MLHLNANPMDSLEASLARALGSDDMGLFRGVCVVRLRPNSGIHIISECESKDGYASTALSEVWSMDNASTWVMHKQDKWLVHRLRENGAMEGKMLQPVEPLLDNVHDIAAAPPLDLADTWDQLCVKSGRGLPWGQLAVRTFTLPRGCLALVVPHTPQVGPVTDVLFDARNGGSVNVWAKGMERKVVEFRKIYKQQPARLVLEVQPAVTPITRS